MNKLQLPVAEHCNMAVMAPAQVLKKQGSGSSPYYIIAEVRGRSVNLFIYKIKVLIIAISLL